MPQLSIETFVTQYVSLIVILLTFYYFIVTYFIPRISEFYKVREVIGQEKADKSEGSDETQGRSLISNIMKIKGLNKEESIYEENYKKNNLVWVQNKI